MSSRLRTKKPANKNIGALPSEFLARLSDIVLEKLNQGLDEGYFRRKREWWEDWGWTQKRMRLFADKLEYSDNMFRRFEQEKFLPFLDDLRRRHEDDLIRDMASEMQITAGLNAWGGTQKELAILALKLYRKKKFKNLTKACEALCKLYQIEGKSINSSSLYSQAKALQSLEGEAKQVT